MKQDAKQAEYTSFMVYGAIFHTPILCLETLPLKIGRGMFCCMLYSKRTICKIGRIA